jgi:dihydropteroate synthase
MQINCRGQLIDLSEPQLMGILNRTPDSFYASSRSSDLTDFLNQAEKQLSEGALFLDVGGYSSRPGADDVSEAEEIKRVVPAIEALAKRFPEAFISVDSFRSGVARKALEVGAHLINDITAGQGDPAMWEVAREMQVPYIAMHMRGTPQTMQQQTEYKDLMKDLLLYFSQLKSKAAALGLNDLLIDPGFGFAKNREQNFQVLAQLELLQSLGLPILIGLSRKSMIYKTLETSPEKALNGSTALHAIALYNGAHIIRTHDIAEARECVRLVREMAQFS